MADAQDQSRSTGTNDEVPPGGIFSPEPETEEGEKVSPPAAESLDDVEKQKQERLEEARAAMQESGEEGDIPGTGVQEEETARIAESVVFPGTGVREFQDISSKEELEEAVENLRVEQEEAVSAQEDSDRIPPAEWPPKEGSSS